MSALTWETRPEDLRDPAVVVAFSGWNDAAEASTTALAAIAEALGAEHVGTIDLEDYLDFQAARPTIDLSQPGDHNLVWPEIEIRVARPARAPRDLVLFAGPEPAARWRGFCDLVLGEAKALGSTLLVGLGSLIAELPHTRPVPVTGIATPASLVEGMDFRSPSYRGPTGIVGVLHALAAEHAMEAVSLWAPVPHYVAAAPNPPGALALVRAFEIATGIAVGASALEEAAREHGKAVSAAVERDPAARELVDRLETALDADDAMQGNPIPSGDTIASQFEQFLKQLGDEPPK